MSLDRDRLAEMDRRAAEIVAKAKAEGTTVRPTHLDKLPTGISVFSKGRNRRL